MSTRLRRPRHRHARGLALALCLGASACSVSDDAAGADAAGSVGERPVLESCEPTPERCDGLGEARPGRLSEHAAGHDPERGELIVVGGSPSIPAMCAPGGPVKYLDETWIYDEVCNAWTRVEGPGPSPSGRHMAAFGDGSLWLFGGRFREPDAQSSRFELYDDLFRFDNSERRWHNVEASGERPSPRVNGAMAWDDKRKRLWLFGGNASDDGLLYEALADLYSFDPEDGSWRRHQPSEGLPPARLFASALYDRKRDALVVYGGADESAFDFAASYFADLWSLDLETLSWTRLHRGNGDGNAPEGRFWAGLVHDETRDRYLLFGGHDDQALGNRNDTWSFDPESEQWQLLSSGDEWNTPALDVCLFPPDFTVVDHQSPERRSSHTLHYSRSCDRALLFGGKTDCGSIDDLWAHDGDGWQPLLEATEGEACLRWRDDGADCSDMCF
ncbi:MAG: hypothetical protein OEZ06_09125 [Myxococcales bacterium]|nr:hypothetical protein [Myxococcales bacterium]